MATSQRPHKTKHFQPCCSCTTKCLTSHSTKFRGLDEQPVQLVKEARSPIEATAEHPKRIDYEYERAGTASIFMFTEPLAGWRQATARESKTKVDWAIEVAQLLEGRYADCEKVILVSDNLNTHTKGAFYTAFEPARARALVRRLEFCHTPKHGSW